MNAQRLHRAGIDYEAGLARFLDDRELYEAVLSAFLADRGLEHAREALARGDRKTLFECIHEMKGSSGNADMTDLYGASCMLVQLLRANAGMDEIGCAFASFESAYTAAREGIREASEG